MPKTRMNLIGCAFLCLPFTWEKYKSPLQHVLEVIEDINSYFVLFVIYKIFIIANNTML